MVVTATTLQPKALCLDPQILLFPLHRVPLRFPNFTLNAIQGVSRDQRRVHATKAVGCCFFSPFFSPLCPDFRTMIISFLLAQERKSAPAHLGDTHKSVWKRSFSKTQVAKATGLVSSSNLRTFWMIPFPQDSARERRVFSYLVLFHLSKT